MAGTPAQNGNNAAGNSDFTRKMDDLVADIWPTPKALTGGANSKRSDRGAGGPDLQEKAKDHWQTPASDSFRSRGGDRKGEMGLDQQARKKNWTTPQAHDVTMRGAGQVPSAKAGNACLARDATNWATPAATEVRQGLQIRREGMKGTQISLTTQALTDFHSPLPAPETEPGGRTSFLDDLTLRRHCLSITSHLPQAVQNRLLRSSDKARLNPTFVEWLMGWPPGHALSNCSATEFILWSQRMRGALSAMPWASGPWIWEPKAELMEVQGDLFG
jgi:hypothetical protein